jgi:hypothetical protein
MPEETYSFVFDRQSASEVFRQVGKRELMLAVMATVTPEPAWDDCLVYEGETPLEEVKTVCIGIQGPAADKVQVRLVEAFEKQGVRVLEVYEGGPEIRERIAVASDKKWVTGSPG